MNTYTRDQNKLETELVRQYDITTGTMTAAPATITSATMTLPSQPSPRVLELRAERAALMAYLRSKMSSGDLHAVQDAASDLREIDARLDELSRL